MSAGVSESARYCNRAGRGGPTRADVLTQGELTGNQIWARTVARRRCGAAASASTRGKKPDPCPGQAPGGALPGPAPSHLEANGPGPKDGMARSGTWRPGGPQALPDNPLIPDWITARQQAEALASLGQPWQAQHKPRRPPTPPQPHRHPTAARGQRPPNLGRRACPAGQAGPSRAQPTNPLIDAFVRSFARSRRVGNDRCGTARPSGTRFLNEGPHARRLVRDGE